MANTKYRELRELLDFFGVNTFKDGLTDANAQYTSPESHAQFLDAMATIAVQRRLRAAQAEANSVAPRPFSLSLDAKDEARRALAPAD
jgi:hypothetical protein